jgi:hypothetical protein
MIQMACNAMNNIWVKAINTSPMFARFGIKGNHALSPKRPEKKPMANFYVGRKLPLCVL